MGFATASVGQSHKTTTKPALSDSYAKAALLALKKIEVDVSSPDVIDGQVTGNGETVDAINSADVEGTTPAEQSVTTALNNIYGQKLANNARRAMKEAEYETAEHIADDNFRHAFANEKMEKDPDIIKISARESECFNSMDAMLRARSSAVPKACDSISK